MDPSPDEPLPREYVPSLHLMRLLELIKLLSVQPLSAREIVERLQQHYASGASGERRVRADIRQLREWDFHIEARRNPQRYVITFNPLAMPLDDEQIDTLATLRDGFGSSPILSNSINQLLALLTANLTNEQRQRYHQPVPLRLALTPAANYDTARPLLHPLIGAIRARRQVQFAYRSLEQRDAPLLHTVDPYTVEFYQQHIYLVAYSHSIHQLTDFRLDQIVPESFQSLPTLRYREHDLYPYYFRYRLSAKLARRGISERFHDQQVVRHFADGSVEVAARARSQFYALRGLLRYATSATATFPEELVSEMKATLDAMRAQYEY